MAPPKIVVAVAIAVCLALASSSPSGLTAQPDQGVRPGEFEIRFPRQMGFITDLAIGPGGEIVVGGVVFEPDFPTTPDAVDRTCGDTRPCWIDGYDTVVMIYSPEGELRYSTFVGGDGEDSRMLVAPAPDGSVWALLADTTVWGGYFYKPPFCNGEQPVLLRIKPGSPVFHDIVCIGGPLADATVAEMAVARDGSLWVFGYAGSFQTVNAWQPVARGWQDLFVARYVPGRAEPLFATFIGGRGSEWAADLALAPDGDAILTGETSSPDFPTVRQAPELLRDGGIDAEHSVDAFLVRMDSSGRYLEYSLQVGGSGWTSGKKVAVDPAGNAYMAGNTASSDFPQIGEGTAPTWPTGISDAYVLSVDAAGRPRFATRVGGSGWDTVSEIVVRPDGTLLTFGWTNSPDFADSLDPPAFQASSRLFIRQTDPFSCSLRCLQARVLVPTRHESADHVVQRGAHLFITGRLAARDSSGQYLGDYGHYLKKWRIGRALPDDAEPMPRETKR